MYDAIVIGAGSAGCVVAAGLASQPDKSVLLIEAGPDDGNGPLPRRLRSQSFWFGLLEPGRLWPNLRATKVRGQQATPYLRGRGLGGSSSINGMAALRGTPADYDRWDDELGCDGWNWAAMEAAFERVEDDLDFGNSRSPGPLPLKRSPIEELSPLDQAVRQALSALGYPECDNYHAPGATGVSRVALTVRDGSRVAASDAYLAQRGEQENLDVRGNVTVDRVLLDGRRSVGVRTRDGEEFLSREVFVCAGAIHSPAILLRSGIGVDDTLPVGANLIDHPMTAPFELHLTSRGQAQSPRAPASTSMLRYTSGLSGCAENDMQISWHSPIGIGRDATRRGWLLGEVMRVFSRGSLRLGTLDPDDDPIVDLQLLDDPRDLARLRDAVRRMLRLAGHPALRAIVEGVRVHDGTGSIPVELLDSDDEIDAWLLRSANDSSHASGTCRMGRVEDPAAVVDTRCNVIGYEGLRVCDASVMPDIPSANTNLTVVAIADNLVRSIVDGRSSSERTGALAK